MEFYLLIFMVFLSIIFFKLGKTHKNFTLNIAAGIILLLAGTSIAFTGWSEPAQVNSTSKLTVYALDNFTSTYVVNNSLVDNYTMNYSYSSYRPLSTSMNATYYTPLRSDFYTFGAGTIIFLIGILAMFGGWLDANKEEGA